MEPLKFIGNAKSYFSIWIANLFLSIITLGVFTAWAKVRRLKYFYGNTIVFGDSFGYHATGGRILKGRLIALLVLAVVAVADYLAGALMSLVLFFSLPWIINQSLKFNARMTSWRNVRFDWHGNYLETFMVFYVWPAVSLLSLGFAIPYAQRMISEYLVNCHSFGSTRFSVRTGIRPYYRALAKTIVFLFATVLLATGVFFLFAGSSALPVLFYLVLILIVLCFLFFSALVRNIVFSSMRLGEAAEFRSNLNPWKVVWIIASNFAVCAATLFLMLPWAEVRIYKYIAENTAVIPKTDDMVFTDEEGKEVSSFGEGVADIEGIDVDFGV